MVLNQDGITPLLLFFLSAWVPSSSMLCRMLLLLLVLVLLLLGASTCEKTRTASRFFARAEWERMNECHTCCVL
jgi:hypothetical protein